MQKFTAIESLRGWMAWWVVLGHAMHVTSRPDFVPAAIVEGWLGIEMAVQVFMVVSGFVITHLLLVKPEPYSKYIGRRFFRLAPLYAFLVIVAILVRDLYTVTNITNPWSTDIAMRAARMAHEEANWLPHALLHLFALHGAVPDSAFSFSSSTFLGPAWSLSLEWQFYLIAPWLIAGMMSVRKAWIAVIGIGLTALAWSGMIGTWRYLSFLPLALPYFFGGITSRLLLEKRIPWLALGLTAAVTLAYLLVAGKWRMWNLVPIAAIWLPFFAITAIEAGVLPIRNKWIDRLSWLIALNPVVSSLGKVSYSTYLCHIPVFAIVVGTSIWMTGRTDQPAIILFAGIAVAAVLPVSYLLYRYIEAPGIRAGNRILNRERSVTAPATLA